MRDKDLLQPATRVDTTCWQLFHPAINTAHFYFFVAEVMSNYLTTDGLKTFSLLPDAPFRPEARGICLICHMVNPALEDGTSLCVEEAASREHRRSIVDTATLRRVCHEERVSIVHEVIVPTNTKFYTCSGNSKLI